MNVVYDLIRPAAQKELDRIPKDIFSQIDRAIWHLRKNPRPFGTKKLDRDLYRIRVRKYRIIYAIFDRDHRIVILKVTRRSEKTYKNLS